MEQVQQLLEILKQTPEMALWGLGLYFLFVLLKIAGWVGAITAIARLLIKRYYDHQNDKLGQTEAKRVLDFFESRKVSSINSNKLIELLMALRKDSIYLHECDIDEAIKIIKKGNPSTK